MSGTDERVTELEARYTIQADMIQKLSDVLWEQQKQLDAVNARLGILERRLANADDPEPRDEGPPPHY